MISSYQSNHFVLHPPMQPAPIQSYNLSVNDQRMLNMSGLESITNAKKDKSTNDDQSQPLQDVCSFNNTQDCPINLEKFEGTKDENDKPKSDKVRKIKIENPDGVEIQLKVELEKEKERLKTMEKLKTGIYDIYKTRERHRKLL